LEVTGADLSEEALVVAKSNGKANGVEINWLQGDLTQAVKGKMFDLVVCNPPYVSKEEYDNLDRGVKDFEPKLALVAGQGGFEFYERLAQELPPILNEGAQVFFEIGSTQGDKVKSLFLDGKWGEMEVLPDWAGLDRFFFLKM
jgi:release factor glutamine methyltransferase